MQPLREPAVQQDFADGQWPQTGGCCRNHPQVCGDDDGGHSLCSPVGVAVGLATPAGALLEEFGPVGRGRHFDFCGFGRTPSDRPACCGEVLRQEHVVPRGDILAEVRGEPIRSAHAQIRPTRICGPARARRCSCPAHHRGELGPFNGSPHPGARADADLPQMQGDARICSDNRAPGGQPARARLGVGIGEQDVLGARGQGVHARPNRGFFARSGAGQEVQLDLGVLGCPSRDDLGCAVLAVVVNEPNGRNALFGEGV